MVPLIENNSCVDWSWGDKASRDHKQRQAEGIAHQHHGKQHSDQDRGVGGQTDRWPLGPSAWGRQLGPSAWGGLAIFFFGLIYY